MVYCYFLTKRSNENANHGVKYARIRFSRIRIFPYIAKYGLEKTRILANFTPSILCSGIAIDDELSA